MKNKSPFHNAKLTLQAWGLDLSATLLKHVPVSVRYKILSRMGRLLGPLAHQQKAALELNLSRLLGINGPLLNLLTQEIFSNFAVTLGDFFIPDNIVTEAPQREMLETLRSRHNGLLMLTFHMGNWELGARLLGEWGWPVTAVYQPYENTKFKQVIEKRRAKGVHFIPVGHGAAAGVREALRRGDVVAMLGDHPFGEGGTPVDLLGHRVVWPKGPALLAVREKTPIVIATVIRTKPGHYQVHIEEPLIPESSGRDEVDRLTQKIAHKFGMLLAQHANQWARFLPFDFAEDNSPVTPARLEEVVRV